MLARSVDADKSPKARSDERNAVGCRGDEIARLFQHACDCQGGEIRLVQVWRLETNASFGESRGEKRRLRRSGRRRKAVQVNDGHQSSTVQPGRQRQRIDPSPSVE